MSHSGLMGSPAATPTADAETTCEALAPLGGAAAAEEDAEEADECGAGVPATVLSR
jgi:hypothetical protein